MSYFILNINLNKLSKVDHWMDERKIAPIFYGFATLDNIRNNSEHKLPKQAYADAKLFVDTFSPSINQTAIIFSIGDQYVYFYKQAGELKEIEKTKENLVKGFQVKLIKRIKISDCPLVLVTIKSNRYISAGTFRKIEGEKYYGNINAIDYILNKRKVVVESFDRYLQCLSSLEFETLVAKYLEELGFFVPAYKGGFIRNYDLFCKNISNKSIVVLSKKVSPNSSLATQVKLRMNKKIIRKYLDLYFCIWSDVCLENIVDGVKLYNLIKFTPETKQWLEQSLYWVTLQDKNLNPPNPLC